MPHTATEEALLSRIERANPQDRVWRSMLLDFYGELLSPRQRECCELHFYEDLSLTEIAETCGISRQGAWDNIRRGSEALKEIEAKTGLLRRHTETMRRLRAAADRLMELEARCDGNAGLRELAQAAHEEIRVLLEDGGRIEYGL